MCYVFLRWRSSFFLQQNRNEVKHLHHKTPDLKNMDTQTSIICSTLLTVASLGIDFWILDAGLFLEDTVDPLKIIPGSSKCVKFVPFHPKNIPKGGNSTYLEDPGITFCPRKKWSFRRSTKPFRHHANCKNFWFHQIQCKTVVWDLYRLSAEHLLKICSYRKWSNSWTKQEMRKCTFCVEGLAGGDSWMYDSASRWLHSAELLESHSDTTSKYHSSICA